MIVSRAAGLGPSWARTRPTCSIARIRRARRRSVATTRRSRPTRALERGHDVAGPEGEEGHDDEGQDALVEGRRRCPSSMTRASRAADAAATETTSPAGPLMAAARTMIGTYRTGSVASARGSMSSSPPTNATARRSRATPTTPRRARPSASAEADLETEVAGREGQDGPRSDESVDGLDGEDRDAEGDGEGGVDVRGEPPPDAAARRLAGRRTRGRGSVSAVMGVASIGTGPRDVDGPVGPAMLAVGGRTHHPASVPPG